MKHGLVDKEFFDLILKKATNKSKEHPYTFFQKRVIQYWNFRIECARSLSAKQWTEIANQNFVVNIVSALEHYFKKMIKCGQVEAKWCSRIIAREDHSW